MEKSEGVKTSHKVKKFFLFGAIAFLVFVVSGFFIIPPILKSVLVNKISETLKREVTINKVNINPFILSLKIKGLNIKERDNSSTFLSFDELYADFQAVSIFKKGIIVHELRLESPYLNIIRNPDGSYNFSDLIKKEKTDSKPLMFSINNIQITKGGIDFFDSPKNTKHKITQAVLKLPFISNLPYYVDIFVQPFFHANVNDTNVYLEGRTRPFKDSLETSLDIELKDFDIAYYLSYLPGGLNFNIDSGLIDANTNIAYTQYKDRHPTINLKGGIDLKKFSLTDLKKSPLISIPLLNISIESSDLMSKIVKFSRLTFHSPEVHIKRGKDGEFNFLSIIPEKKEDINSNKNSTNKDTSPAVDADKISIDDGKVYFVDNFYEKPFKADISGIKLHIDHFSNQPQKRSSITLDLKTDAEETLSLKGDFSLNPIFAGGELLLKEILLKRYHPYYSDKVLFDIEGGALTIKSNFLFEKESKNMSLSGLGASIDSLKLRRRDEKNEFLFIPSLLIKDTNVDINDMSIIFGEIATKNGFLSLKRYTDNKINLLSLLPPNKEKTIEAKKSEKKEWQITTKKLLIDNYTFKIEDLMPEDPVRLNFKKVSLKADNISTIKNIKGKGNINFQIEDKGNVSASGNLGINPPSANIKITARNIPITPVQPYFTERIKIYVIDGNISSEGNLNFSVPGDNQIKISYSGNASITNFSSIDKLNAEDFFKFGSLYINDIKAEYSPLYLNIAGIALNDFYSRVIVKPDGTLNIQDILVKEDTQKDDASASIEKEGISKDAKETTQKTFIKIDTVTLQNGRFSFSDYHIKPNYSANFLEIGGRISGLSSEENKFADVDLRGSLENYAPLEIKGRINPLKEDLYIELSANFKDMDLSHVTPYSGKYLGYTIQKGKLSFNLQYLIIKKKLDAENNIFLDQLTLGDRVESEKATKLPVKLAIALLKDRKGQIKLDIPVSGNIDDPEFSLGKIIIKILVNLLVKAATSPFALLGAIFGGGEELSFVEFDYGSFQINQMAEQKLNTLIKALSERPSLNLEIEGYVDMERDKEGLRQYVFNRKIKAQKLKEIAKKGEQALNIDDIKIQPEEYQKYLKMAYKEEKFPKPRNILGMAKDLPVQEMEKLMLTHIEIKEDDLKELAQKRALNVKDYILKSGQIQPERIFLINPQKLNPEKKEKTSDSRVDFKLK